LREDARELENKEADQHKMACMKYQVLASQIHRLFRKIYVSEGAIGPQEDHC